MGWSPERFFGRCQLKGGADSRAGQDIPAAEEVDERRSGSAPGRGVNLVVGDLHSGVLVSAADRASKRFCCGL